MDQNKVQINLFDAETNETYPIFLSPADSERCQNDMEFAQQLLLHAKNEQTVEMKTYHLQEEDTDQGDPFAEMEPNTSSAEENLEVNQAWSRNESLALISAYDTHKENFNVAKKRKFVWLDIANEMNSNGHQRSAAKCENKWRNLLRTYKNVKDIQGKSGRGAGRFRFFDQMDDILGDKPSTSSPHTFSSTKPATIVNEEKEEEVKENKSLEADKKLIDENTHKLTPKRKRVEKLDEQLKKKSEDLMNMKINYLKKKEEDGKNKELRRQRKMELKEKMMEIEEKKVALLEKFLENETLK